MASFNIGSLFGSSLFGGSSAGSSIFSAMSDYNAIRNGSYYKLLKTYYNGNAKAKPQASSKPKAEEKDYFSTSDTKTAAAVRDSSKELKDNALKLLDRGKNSLFNKVEVKGQDGTKTQEYDKDAIYKAVSSYVDSYNNTIRNAANSDNKSVVAAANNIINATRSNKNLLSDVGISVGTDNKLTIDEKAFKESSMADVKILFNGVGSYAYRVSNSASGIYNQSVSQLARSSGSSYNSGGGYSGYPYSGSLYNNWF